MVNGYANFSKSNPNLKPLVDRLKKLAKSEVYVGVPAENAPRQHTDKINNAELLYIHSHGIRRREMREEMDENIKSGMKYSKAHSLYIQSHGSPLWHAPPRPVLEPAIENAKEDIGAALANASRAALNNDPAATEDALENAGAIAQNAARRWFDDPRNGWAANAPLTIKLKGSAKPLVDTNEMCKAISYVVRAK